MDLSLNETSKKQYEYKIETHRSQNEKGNITAVLAKAS
jgi:hypothetical protein